MQFLFSQAFNKTDCSDFDSFSSQWLIHLLLIMSTTFLSKLVTVELGFFFESIIKLYFTEEELKYFNSCFNSYVIKF